MQNDFVKHRRRICVEFAHAPHHDDPLNRKQSAIDPGAIQLFHKFARPLFFKFIHFDLFRQRGATTRCGCGPCARLVRAKKNKAIKMRMTTAALDSFFLIRLRGTGLSCRIVVVTRVLVAMFLRPPYLVSLRTSVGVRKWYSGRNVLGLLPTRWYGGTSAPNHRIPSVE